MNGVSTIELLLRMTASLLVLGGLFWLLTKAARGRLGRIGRPANAPLEVNDRKQLTKSSSIALIRAGERNLLIGITDAGISLLAEGDDLVLNPDAAESDDEFSGDSGAAKHSSGRHSSGRHSSGAKQPIGVAIGKKLVEGIRARSPLGAAGRKVDAQHEDELAPEMAALARHWDDPDSTQPTGQMSDTSSSTTSSTKAEARKPRRGASSSTESGTSALDALRAMTVRRP